MHVAKQTIAICMANYIHSTPFVQHSYVDIINFITYSYNIECFAQKSEFYFAKLFH